MRGFDLRLLVEHMEWADAALWQAVLATPQAASDARLRQLLHHMALVQWSYLGFWQEAPRSVPALESFPDLAALREWARATHTEIARFIGTAPDPGRLVPIPWEAELAARFGVARPASLGDTLLQVSSHSTYHRGQVNARIRELGGEPAEVDYIIWIWAGRPEAAWTAPGVAAGEP